MNTLQKIFGMAVFMLLVSTPVLAAEIPVVKAGNIQYRTQVQNIGWQDWKDEGEQSGTSGKGLRLEGIEIETINMHGADVGVRYQTHVQNIGWQDWVVDGETSGTVGRGLRLEAIRIELTGADADKYDIYYKVHAQNIGWLGWAKGGENSGTAGYGYRLEAIQILLKEKGEASPVESGKVAYKEYDPKTDAGSSNNTGDGLGWPDADSTGSSGNPLFGGD